MTAQIIPNAADGRPVGRPDVFEHLSFDDEEGWLGEIEPTLLVPLSPLESELIEELIAEELRKEIADFS